MIYFVLRNELSSATVEQLIKKQGYSQQDTVCVFYPSKSLEIATAVLNSNHLMIPIIHYKPNPSFYQDCRNWGEAASQHLFNRFSKLAEVDMPWGNLEEALALQIQLLLLSDGIPLYLKEVVNALENKPVDTIHFVDFEIPESVLKGLFFNVSSLSSCYSNDGIKQAKKAFKKLSQSSKLKSAVEYQPDAVLMSCRHRNGYDFKIQAPFLKKYYSGVTQIILCPESFQESSFLSSTELKDDLANTQSVFYQISDQSNLRSVLVTKILKAIKQTYSTTDPFLNNLLHYYFQIHQKGLQYYNNLKATEPKYVSGCFDIAVDGVLLNDLKRDFNFSWINFQHGLMGQHKMLDRYDFDQYVVWFDETKEHCLSDGFKNERALVVESNPLWTIKEPFNIEHEEVKHWLNWKATSKLIGFYSQSSKSFLTPYCLIRSVNKLTEQVLSLNCKLAIFSHPQEKHNYYTWFRQILPKSVSEQVKISFGKLKSSQSLQLVDVVYSIFSTVLCDAKYQFNVPAQVVDTEGVSLANPLDIKL